MLRHHIWFCEERFYMTSRPPYWCSKTMKQRPCVSCGVEPFSSVKTSCFFSNKFSCLLATWVKRLYSNKFHGMGFNTLCWLNILSRRIVYCDTGKRNHNSIISTPLATSTSVNNCISIVVFNLGLLRCRYHSILFSYLRYWVNIKCWNPCHESCYYRAFSLTWPAGMKIY